MVAFRLTDDEWCVTHAQAGVTPLLRVGARSAPVLAQEECESFPGGPQILLVGVEGEQVAQVQRRVVARPAG